MPDPRPVEIGEPFLEFPAQSFNALVAGELARKAQEAQAHAQSRGTAGRVPVNCHNSTSTTIEPGWILGFDEPSFTVADDPQAPFNAPSVKGITPTAEHSNRFVVALDYILGSGDETGGTVGPAVLQGLAWAKVNWTDDAHTKVAVEAGETMLQSASAGITPIWHEDIPDPEYLPAELWALILIGGGTSSGGSGGLRLGRVVVAIPAATNTYEIGWAQVSAAVSLIDPATGEESDPENPIDVINKKPVSYAVDAQVSVTGDDPALVEIGTCYALPESFWLDPEYS